MLEKIKSKYNQLDCKGSFIKLLAQDRGLKESSVRQNWIKLWQIPEKHQDRFLELLNKTIALQEKYKAEKANLIK